MIQWVKLSAPISGSHCCCMPPPSPTFSFHAWGPRASACFLALGFFHCSKLSYIVEISFFKFSVFVVSVKSPQVLFILCIDHFMEIEEKNKKPNGSRSLQRSHSSSLPSPSPSLPVILTGISARLLPSDLCSELEVSNLFHSFDLTFRCLMNPILYDWFLLDLVRAIIAA